jgi:hypothetical protein
LRHHFGTVGRGQVKKSNNTSIGLDGKNYFYESNETPNMTIELSKEVRQQAISSIIQGCRFANN